MAVPGHLKTHVEINASRGAWIKVVELHTGLVELRADGSGVSWALVMAGDHVEQLYSELGRCVANMRGIKPVSPEPLPLVHNQRIEEVLERVTA